METISNNLQNIYNKIENYTNTTIDLVKLHMVDKSADVLSSLVANLIMILVFALFTFFINFGLASYLGSLLNSTYLGFFIVSIFYLLIGIVLYFYKNKFIKAPLSDTIVENLLKKTTLEEELKNEIIKED